MTTVALAGQAPTACGHRHSRFARMALLVGLVIGAAVTLAPNPSSGQVPSTAGWHRIPDTKISAVCAATNGFPTVWGAEGCAAILSWSGGVFDTKRNRLIVWGGGHNGYYGNELYAFNLADSTMTRLNDPGLPIAPGSPCVEGIVNNTQANSRHTYDGIEYMPNVDRMFVFSGSLACSVGSFGNETWTFDFGTMKWHHMSPGGTRPQGEAGMLTAYDPNTGLIFLHDRRYLYSYDFGTNTYTRLSNSLATLGYHMTATIDPKRRKFVIVGFDSVAAAGRVYMYDIGPGSTYQKQTVATTGESSIVGRAYPGLDYDPMTDRIVAWSGGDTVYSLSLDTRAWTATTYGGGPGPVGYHGYGSFGRWRFSPTSGVFVLVNDYAQDAYVLRRSPGEFSPTPPAAPTNLQVR
jgi:hypothetical protein